MRAERTDVSGTDADDLRRELHFTPLSASIGGVYDAARGDRTLFTSASGIERLWSISQPLIENPPMVRPYAQGSWGPNQIHQLIAPYTWRLPFERQWRERKV